MAMTSRAKAEQRVGKLFHDAMYNPELQRKIGEAIVEHVNESAHMGWPGFTRADMTGIYRFLDDFVAGYENRE